MKIKQEPDFTDDKWWFVFLMAPVMLVLGAALLIIMAGLTVMEAYYWLCERFK